MQHVLTRHAAQDAARAKTRALGTLHACATAFGAKDAHLGFNDFVAGLDAIISHACPTDDPGDNGVTAEEIAFFERIERQALANQQKQ